MTVVPQGAFMIILHSIHLGAVSSASDIYTGTTFAVSFPNITWIQTMCLTVTPVGKAPVEVRVIDAQTRAVTLNRTIRNAVKLNYSQIVGKLLSRKGYIINSSDSILTSIKIPTTNHTYFMTSLLPVTSWGNESVICSSDDGASKELIITKVDGNSFETTFTNLSDVVKEQYAVIELHQRGNTSERYPCYSVLSEKPALVTSVFQNYLSIRPPVSSWGRQFLLFSVTNTLHVILNANSSNNTVHTSSSLSNASVAVLQQYERAHLNTTPNTLVSIVSSQPSSITSVDLMVNEIIPDIDQYGNCYSFITKETGRTVLVIVRKHANKSLFLNGNRIQNFHLESSVTLSGTWYVVLKIAVPYGSHRISSDTAKFALLNTFGKFLPGITKTTCVFIRSPAVTTQSATNDHQLPLFVFQNNPNTMLNKTTPNTPYGDGEAISPAVMAIVISISSAVFLVVVCIIGFIVAELFCRRGGDQRNSKVTPYTE